VAEKLKRIDIVYKKSKGDWIAESGGRTIARAAKKSQLVPGVASKAKRSGGTSVVIHKRTGEIQEERTYPRSADPRKTKG
jgi:hypothetical protein